MPSRARRLATALCGVLGVAMLTAHFLIPSGIPRDSAATAEIVGFVRRHHHSVLLSAWLQVAGATLYVLFVLVLVDAAHAGRRLAGRIALLSGTVLVAWSLLDSALIIAAVEAATHGHPGTLRVTFDLIGGPGNDAVGRSFLIAPAILIPVGVVLLKSRLLPSFWGGGALAFGVANQVLGSLVLFSRAAFVHVVPVLLALENLWFVAIAIAFVCHRPHDEVPDRSPALGGVLP